MSEALPPVPARLVKKILMGDFVDMAELLHDNTEVERRRGQLEGATLHGQMSGRANRREVPDILSWVQCLAVYAAVVATQHPGKTRELLAYMALMISESRRCGG